MGMVGMIIALPLTTLMLSYYQRFIINKEHLMSSPPAEETSKPDESTAPESTGERPQ